MSRSSQKQLMYALDCDNYNGIIEWALNGLSFTIIDPVKFEKTVLPKLFREAKFVSFDRKVSDESAALSVKRGFGQT